MFKQILKTENDHAALVLRVLLGVVFFPHGAQKLLGWFGGGGFQTTMQALGGMGIPAFFVVLVIIAEFFGAIALVIGFFGRIAAFGIGMVMLVATLMVHGKNGFFMNWYMVPDKGHGFEFHLLAMAIALAVMIKGSGAMSLDRAIAGGARSRAA